MSNVATSYKQASEFCEELRKILSAKKKTKLGCLDLNISGRLDKFEKYFKKDPNDKDPIDPEFIPDKLYESLRDRYLKLAGEAKDAEVESNGRKQKKAIKQVLTGFEKLTNDFDEFELKRAHWQPVYIDKRDRINQAIQKLKALPGAKKQVGDLDNLRSAGDQEIKDTGNFEQAYKKLQGLTNALKEGETAYDVLINGGVSVAFPAARKNALEAINKYDKVAGLGDKDTIKDYRTRYDECVNSLANEKPPKYDVAATTMETLSKEAGTKLDDFNDDLIQCTTQQKEAEKQLKIVETFVPVDEYSELLSEKRLADALFTGQKLSLAQEKYETLTKKLENDKKIEEHEKQYNGWIASRDRVEKECVPDLKLAMSLGLNTNLFSKELSSAITEYSTAKDTVGRTRDFKKAKEFADKINKHFQEKVKEKMLGYHNLDAKRKQALIDIEQKYKAAEVKLKDLETKGGYCDELRAELEKAQKCNLAVSESKDLQQNKDKCLEAIQDVIKSVEEILADTTTGGKLEQSQKSRNEHTAKNDVDNLLRDLKSSIDSLLLDRASDQEIAGFKKTRDDLEENSRKLTDKVRLKEAQQLHKKLATKVKAIEQELQNEAKAINSIGDACQKKLKQLRGKHKQFAGWFDEIDREIKSLLSCVDSTVVKVRDNGREQLTSLSKKLDNAGSSLEKVTTKLVKDETDLNSADFKELFPERRTQLKARFENAVAPECYRMDPSKSLSCDVYKTFSADLKHLQDATVTTQNNRTEIKKAAKSLRKDLEKLQDVPKLKASFESQIKAAESPGDNGEADALRKLESLTLIVEKCLAQSPKGETLRITLEQRATEQELRTQLERKKWLGAIDVFTKNTQKKADDLFNSLSRAERNTDAYKLIASDLKQAKKLAKAGDYTQANRLLQDAEKNARKFIANPHTVATTARKQLGDVQQKWTEAVVNYLSDLNSLREEISKFMKEKKLGEKDVNGVFTDLESLFDAVVFKDVVNTLQKELPKKSGDLLKALPERRRMKELGLRHVQRFQQTVKSNVLLQHLEKENLFTPGKDYRAGITQALGDLELNLKRA